MLRYLCLLGADDSRGVQLWVYIPDTLDVSGSGNQGIEGAEVFWKNAQDKVFNGEVHKWEQRLEYSTWKQRNWRYICCIRELEVIKSEKVRRETCRMIRNRIRTAGGKGPRRAFNDYRESSAFRLNFSD